MRFILNYIKQAQRDRKKRRKLLTAMWSLSILVAVGVFWQLRLPGITLSGDPICGIAEHTHSLSCQGGTFACTVAPHTHGGDCYDAEGNQTCGMEDFLVHTHDSLCYDGEGILLCALEEVEAHTHEEGCYTAQEPLVHTHGESCYSWTKGETMVCTQPEQEPHTHEEGCYGITCGQEEISAHKHTAACYACSDAPLCGQEETPGHQHSDACRRMLNCTEEHEHEEVCYLALSEDEVLCGQEEYVGHQHDDSCRQRLICTQDHDHGAACYSYPEVVQCGLAETEGHAHGEGCNGLTCTLSVEGHAHGDSCYEQLQGELICTESTDPVEQEPKLTCEKEEILLHAHTDECYTVNAETQEKTLVCTTLEIKAHQHSEGCYILGDVCTVAEHTHVESCYPAPGDVEGTIEKIAALPTPAAIEEALAGYAESGDTEGQLAYVQETLAQLKEAQAAYEALTEEEQAAVTNGAVLAEYEAVLARLKELDPSQKEIVGETYESAMMDGSLTASIVTEGQLPEGSVFVISNLSQPGFQLFSLLPVEESTEISEAERVAIDAVDDYMFAQGMVVEEYLPLEMHFMDEDGNEVQPNGTTEVTLNFTPAILHGEGDIYMMHVTDGGVEDVTREVVRDEDGGVTQIVLRTDSFSTIMPVRAVQARATTKTPKDNSSQLTILPTADTSSLITMNLYDYNNQVSVLYSQNKNLPGFQNEGGTRNVGTSLNRWASFNFGNTITSNIYDSATQYGLTNAGGLINATANGANSPISGAIQDRLGADGYPALVDGNLSLKYLFSSSSAATKMNTANITGLFLYDAATGSYSYNSRENHAQFNAPGAEPNTFTVYKERLTPNHMMYPFGNFMPLNDIVYLAKKSSQIDATYLAEIANSATQKYQTTNSNDIAYKEVGEELPKFNTLMNNKFGVGWTAEKAINEYFRLSNIPKTFTNAELDQMGMYTIDYDEPSNFFFGFDMSMKVMQPKDGLTGPNDDQTMHFYFTGDDDVWVFIDGYLVLDLSGIHRHVGGAIDFQMGTVLYYSLDTSVGDVGNTVGQAYKTVHFEDIFPAEMLQDNGIPRADSGYAHLNQEPSTGHPLKDYSTHDFKFYYMERGSGSSICRLNFTLPMLEENAITVGKALTADDASMLPVLGNPDFSFQILDPEYDANGDGVADDPDAHPSPYFIGEGVTYKILDEYGKDTGRTGVTGAYGIFKLKAGEMAEFTGIAENRGKYVVRELFDVNTVAQYGRVTIGGTSTTLNAENVQIGTQQFVGMTSPVHDASEGTVVFHFENNIDFDQLGTLEFSKVLVHNSGTTAPDSFRFHVTLDGADIAVGTPYTIGTTAYKVTEAGYITLKAGETARIEKILSGSTFSIQEESVNGYTTTYTTVDSTGGLASVTVDTSGNLVSGVIQHGATVGAKITNTENSTFVNLPGFKTLTNDDGGPHTFTFALQQVTDATGATPVDAGTNMTQTVTYPLTATSDFVFQLGYTERLNPTGTYYYKVTETPDPARSIQYSTAAYVAEVTVSGTGAGYTAAITGWYVDGARVENIDNAAYRMEFINTLLAKLTIGKELTGPISPDAQFTFTVTLTQGGAPLTGTYNITQFQANAAAETDPAGGGTGADPAAQTPTTITFDANGSAEITLGGGQRLTIHDLPVGIGWTVSENNSDGYDVTYSVNGAERTEGSQASGTLATVGASIEVVFINYPYIALPHTGGAGLLPYALGGLLTMASALLYTSKNGRKQRKGGRRTRQ